MMHNLRLIGLFFALSTAYFIYPFHVLFVVGHFPAPSQTFILNQMTGLLDRGHTVTIFSFHKDRDNDFVHPAITQYNLMNHVIYTTFPDKLPDCDIVLCQFGYLGKKMLTIPRIQEWLATKKLVTCLRGSDITTRIAPKPQKYIPLFKRGDLFLPVCDYFKTLLIHNKCTAEKVMVHYAAIDCSKFYFKKRKPPVDDALHFISVCRLVEKKGIIYGIRAFAKVLRNYPHAHYDIIGDGPERPYLEKVIKRLQLQDKVTLHGWKSQDDVVKLLKNAHIFMLPSVTAANGNEEGIPNALKEAMAMGLPVIATWHAGNAELIDHGITGFLVPQRDALALARTMIYVIQHAHEWGQIGLRARKKIEQEFEIKKNIERLEGIFYQLLATTKKELL